MEDTVNEAKAALVKSKDNMAKYYNRRRTPALEYQPRDRVYLDAHHQAFSETLSLETWPLPGYQESQKWRISPLSSSFYE